MSEKYCQGFHPSSIIVCGPDPLSGIKPPCVKFPRDIISPTWNNINAQRIRSTRVRPEAKKNKCSMTYKPAIESSLICHDDIIPQFYPNYYMKSDKSGCECGPATITRFRYNPMPNVINVSIGTRENLFVYTLPADGSCLSLTVDQQMMLNQNGAVITTSINNGVVSNFPYKFPICISLSAVTYTFTFIEDVDEICPRIEP